MRIVSVTKTSIHKALVIDSSHFVEKIVGNFGTFHGLFSGIVQFLHGEVDCFVEVEDAKIVGAAEDIEMYLIFHEFELLVEGVVPNYFQIIDDRPILFVPVEPLAHDNSIAKIHLNGGNIFVDNF